MPERWAVTRPYLQERNMGSGMLLVDEPKPFVITRQLLNVSLWGPKHAFFGTLTAQILGVGVIVRMHSGGQEVDVVRIACEKRDDGKRFEQLEIAGPKTHTVRLTDGQSEVMLTFRETDFDPTPTSPAALRALFSVSTVAKTEGS
jgi:hypothetical protein